MQIRLNTIGLRLDGQNFAEGVDHEVGAGDGKIPLDVAQARLVAGTANVVIYGQEALSPGFAEQLADYVAALTGLGERLVIILDLADAGSDADAIALVDAMRTNQEQMGERLGLRMQELFARTLVSSEGFVGELVLDQEEGRISTPVQTLADDGGSASSIGTSSGAADTPVAPTTTEPIEPVMTVQAVTAEPVKAVAPKAKKPAAPKPVKVEG